LLRRIFGPKRDEVMGDWRKLHNEELHNLYSSPNIIRMIKSRRMTWAGQVARMGETRNVYRTLVGKPEEKRPLGRPRHKWVGNLRETGWDGMGWIDLAQNRDQSMEGSCEHGDEPSGFLNAGKFLCGSTIGSFSRRTQLRT
jgi:hypothetical protein